MSKEENTSELNINAIKKGVGITFLGSLLFLYLHFANEKITDQNNLKSIKGEIENYSFLTYSANGRSNLKNYQIQLENLEIDFKIIADDIWLFKESSFEENVKKGDLIKLEVPKEYKSDNNSQDFVPVLGIIVNGQEYLSSREVIRENKAPLFLTTSLVLFFSSISLILLVKFKSKLT